MEPSTSGPARAEDEQLAESLDAIRHMDPSSSEETSSDDTTKSSDDCCWTIFKNKFNKSKLQEKKPKEIKQGERKRVTWVIPEILNTAPSTPSESPEMSGLNRTTQSFKYRDEQLFHELSVDPNPRGCITLARYSVYLTGFPMSQPEVTYSWLIDLCSEFDGYRGLHISHFYEDQVFVEFSDLDKARYAAAILNGRLINDSRLLYATVTVLPAQSTRMTIMETQV